jgi:hypothetical protein
MDYDFRFATSTPKNQYSLRFPMKSVAMTPTFKPNKVENPKPVSLTPKSQVKIHLRSINNNVFSGAAQ